MERFEGINVVAVDDDAEFLFTFKKTLELFFKGVNVITYTVPEEALEELKKQQPHLLFADFVMPNINGEQLIAEYRKFNNDTIIYLQTGKADDHPPKEMLERLNIQGFIDKSKEADETYILLLASMKQAQLVKTVKEQAKIINVQQYEEEFVGRLLVTVTDEMKDQLIVMAGPKMLLEEKANELDNAELKEIVKKWQYSTDKIARMLMALNFKTSYIGNINDLFGVVKTLTLAKSTWQYTETTEPISISNNPKYLVYLLSEIVMYLYENNVSDVEVSAKRNDNGASILINKPFVYSEDIIKKLNNIATFGENISIIIVDNLLEIVIQ